MTPTAPYREAPLRPTAVLRRSPWRVIAATVVLAVVCVAVRWRFTLALGVRSPMAMPAFTVHLWECGARPDGPGPTTRVTVEQRNLGGAVRSATVESNGRWERHSQTTPTQFISPLLRRTGCASPEVFAIFFARFNAPTASDEGALDSPTPTCIAAHTALRSVVRHPEARCDHRALANDIMLAVERLAPEPAPTPRPCGAPICEVALIDGVVAHPHGGGRRHSVALRRDGTFVCDGGDPSDVVHGTITPAEPLFRWLAEGLAALPVEPDPTETFAPFTLSLLRDGTGSDVASVRYASIEPRWSRIAAALPPWCEIDRVARYPAR